MRRKLCLALFLALVTALPLAAQVKQIVVINKYGLAGVAMTADGNLWTAAQPTLNYASALIAVRKTGSVAVCSLALLTGPTAATATAAINDANTTIDCSSAVNKIVTNLDRFLQGTVSSWSGTGTITIYVTLSNGMGWNLNATLSGVTQSTGSGAAGTYWYTRVTNGTQSLPSGDAQARGISTIPGNGTNADKQMLDGVGALGAGVKQVATLGTLSASVAAATLTEVVAANSGSTVLLGVWLEKATATTGTVTVRYGTGTNCGTGTTTLLTLGPQTASSLLPIGYYPVNALVPSTKALCLITDAATTSAKVLTQ